MTTATVSGSAGAIAGYTLVLPPGWERVPVRSGTTEAIKRILDQKLRTVPVKVSRDAIIPYRVMIEGHLRKIAAEARKQGGLDLYLPVDLRGGTLISASFVISEGTLAASGRDPAPAAILTALTEDDDAAPVSVANSPALRREHFAPADLASGTEYGSRRVDYVVPVPDDGSRWLVAAFSTVVNEEAPDWFAKLLVELFDAIMSTLRWTATQSSETMTQRSRQ